MEFFELLWGALLQRIESNVPDVLYLNYLSGKPLDIARIAPGPFEIVLKGERHHEVILGGIEPPVWVNIQVFVHRDDWI